MNVELLDAIDKKFENNLLERGQNTYKKLIVTGHVLEVYEYEKMPPVPQENGKKTKSNNVELEIDISDYLIKDRQKNMNRARNGLRRLITANFDEFSKFITLTFKDNLKDVKQANNEFKKFIQRLRYRYGNFKYAAVVEFQKRGAVHYHMISDLPFVENKKLGDLWGHGFVKINNIEHVDNVGAYMIKYMAKDNVDLRLQGLKSYQTSKNLIRPIEYVGTEVDDILKLYELDNKKTVFSNHYETEYLGLATYKEYNLKRL